jgi:hypothetical protein
VRFGGAASGGVGGGAAALSGAARGVERLRGTSLGMSFGICGLPVELGEAGEGCAAVMLVGWGICLIVHAFVERALASSRPISNVGPLFRRIFRDVENHFHNYI